jgi:uncharacterized delta-60 repeat protein
MKAFATTLALFFTTLLFAQSPLDTTFGVNGKVITSLAQGDKIIKLAEQSDGKIIALGEHHVARYNTNGTLDLSFETGGVLDSLGMTAFSLLVDDNDNIFIGGNDTVPQGSSLCVGSAVLAKYTANGAVDTTFGQNGRIVTNPSLTNARAFTALAMQANGKILAGVHVNSCSGSWGNTYFGSIARFNVDGSRDTSFSSFPSANFTAYIDDVKIMQGGQILAVGFETPGSNFGGSQGCFSGRFNLSDGSIDSTYGVNGVASPYQYGLHSDGGSTILPNGQAYVVSYYYNPLNFITETIYGSIDELGQVDSNFSAIYPDSSYGTNFKAIAAYSNKRLITAGKYNDDFKLVMLDEFAQIDSSCFPPMTIDFGGNDQAHAVLIDKHGDIIVAGSSDTSFAIARIKKTCLSADDFVTTWKTDNWGTWSNDSSIYISTDANYNYAYGIDWNNDGNIDTSGITGDFLLQFPAPGTYTIRIVGEFPSIKFSGNKKIIKVDQWGGQEWKSLDFAFTSCSNLLSAGYDAPNLDSISSLEEMFRHASQFNGQVNHWDMSNINNISKMFWADTAFNQPVNNWDVSNVSNMYGTFHGADRFNQPVNNWNVSNVTSMHSLFAHTHDFNQSLAAWDVSSVEVFDFMFLNADVFNQNIGMWDVSSATSMAWMFKSALAFNQNINSWNVANVRDMANMFWQSVSFNQPLDQWDVSGVKNLHAMFRESPFDQNIGTWQLDSATNLSWMLSNSAMSTTNYDSTLIGWANKSHPSNLAIGAHSLNYCIGENARDSLIADGWIFHGDSKDPNCCIPNGDSISEIGCRYYIPPSGTHVWHLSGTYYDVLQNVGGCDSTLTINLTIVNVDTTVNQTGVELSSNASDTTSTYQWLNCNTMQTIPGETNKTFTATANGSYAVIVTENGCTDTSRCFTVSGIGLAEMALAGINIYPNPSKGYLVLGFETTFVGNLEIYSVSGQRVYQHAINGQPKLELELELANGVYVLKLTSPHKNLSQRLIIQK